MSITVSRKKSLQNTVAQQSMHLTLGIAALRRAAISSSFLRLSIFLVGRLRRPRPSAGNANRSAARS